METKQAEPDERAKKKFVFPHAVTVLAVVTVAVWLIAMLVPSGEYDRDDKGSPVQGSYHRIPAPQDFGDRVHDLLQSPVNGLYGIQDAKTGEVGPDMTGALYGSAGVFFFVLAIGAFITVVFATGALDRGIARLAYRLRDRGGLLVGGIMVVFAVLGSVEGWSEETLGFYGLIVPLMLALGYDRMVACSTILLGSGIGCLCSTVNPFATGVASAAAGVSIGDGIVLRFPMLIVLTGVCVAYVLRYGSKVRKDPAKSMVGFQPGDRDTETEAEEPEQLTGRQRIILWLLGATFALMIFSVIPWSSALTGKADAVPYSWELGWSFPELAALFLVAGIVVGVVGKLGEQKLAGTLVSGAADFISPALVVVLARGITAIMNNAKITDTVLNSLEGVVSGTSSVLFSGLIWLVNLPLAFLIPSTSGHATLAMPVMAPLASFADVPRSLVVTAWQSANGWMNLWVPTSAVILGGLAQGKVGYDKYIRFIAPLLGILAVLILGFLGLGTLL